MSKKTSHRGTRTKSVEATVVEQPKQTVIIRARREDGINRQISTRTKAANQKEEASKEKGVIDFIKSEIVNKAIESQQIDDPFKAMYAVDLGAEGGGFNVLEPPYNPCILRKVPLENNVLLQCIDAMAQNIECTGYTFEYIGPDELEDSKDKGDIASELKNLEAFVSAPNEKYSLQELRKRTRIDRETFGFAFIEVVRDIAGKIQAIYHLPAIDTRATSREKDAQPITYEVQRGDKIQKIQRFVYFRRFVQQSADRIKRVYFKEFGDTRVIHSETGIASSDVPLDKRATEVLMLTDYRVGTLYGYPRWINQVPAILGSRESELMNLQFFKDNGIPAMAVLIAGGELSQDAVNAIEDAFLQKRGRAAHNKIIVLEAYGDAQAANTEGQVPVPRMELKPLVQERQSDGLFQEYDKECQKKVRSSFRIPPIILGLSDDYTLATADASLVVAESQVFQPERNDVDVVINRDVLGDGVNMPKYWRYKSNPTRMVNDEEIANGIKTLNDVGALTANDAINIGNKLFGLNVNQVEEEWGNVPYSLVMKLIEKGHKIKGLDTLVEYASKVDASQQSKEKPSQSQEQLKTVLVDMTNKLNEASKNAGSGL